MQLRYILSGIFFVLALSATAQTISGTVKGPDGKPIPYASISILNGVQGTQANKDGQYSLSLLPGSYQLQVSATGFATVVKAAQLDAPSLQLDVQLEASTKTLGNVIVTANKREEDIVQVATSISSLSAKKIEDTRTWNLGGLTALIPNYNYQELGVPFQQVQSIRGIQVFSENPAVSTYIDDVNNIDILANGFALTDVERIEVLRGPQGTLFGRNAMGGVVNIITKKPTNKAGGFAEISVGNLGLQRYSAGFKTPMVKDKLYFGLNALYQTQDGYWRNDTTGTRTTDRTAHNRMVGGEKNLYGNMYVKWLASKRLSFTLNVKTQTDRSENTGFFVSQASPEIAFANPDKINLSRIGQHERSIVNTSLVMKYLEDDFTITSIYSYQNIGLSFTDIDFPGFFHSFYRKNIGEKLPPQEVLSHEFRISSNNKKKLQYTLGFFGFSQVGYEPSTNLAFESPMFPNTFLLQRNKSNNFGVAGFGELSYQLSDKLKATAGLRYDYERREATFNGFGDAILAGGTVTTFVPDTTMSGKYNALSPKLALSYAVNARSNIYLSYTRGFRAGGVNAQKVPANISTTFNPEYSDNFELGYKTFLVENKLSISAAAFLIQWQDLQFFNQVAPFTFIRENVGDARSSGFELELSAIPAKGLQLDASLGINATEYKAFNLARPSGPVAIGGNRLSNAPGHTLFLAAQYEYPLGKKLKAVVRGELRSMGSYYTDIQNALEQPAYTLLNTRIGLATDRYSIFFWGQNLGNERFLAFGSADTSFGTSVRTAAPRTFGITLSARL